MAAEDKLFKLQNLERTKQLINDINFTKAVQLPKAAGAETLNPTTSAYSQSFLLRRTQDLVNRHDMSAIAPHIKIFSEFDPANPYYSSLLNRINHGEHITWKEFEDAVNRFSSQEYYLTKLQDEINNTKINASLEGVPEEELQKPIPETTETPASETTLEPEKPEPDHSEPHLPHSETETYERPQIIQRRPLPQKTPEQQAQLKQRLKASQTPKTEVVAESKPTVVNKLPQRSPVLSSKTRKKALPKTASTKVGQKIGTAAAIGSGGGAAAGSGVLGNVLGARSLLQAGQWLANKLGLRSLGNLLGKLMPEKLIAQGIRGLWNLGSSLGRSTFDGLIRTLTPRAAPLISGAGSTIGGWFSTAGAFLAGGAGATMALFLTIVLGAFALYLLQQREFADCGKTGSVNIQKQADKESYAQGEVIKYEILISYNLNCISATIDNVEVRDMLPQGSTPIDSSYEAIGLNPQDPAGPNINDPLEGFSDPLNPNDTGVNPEITSQNPNNLEASNIKPTLVNNTLIWKLGTLSPNIPIVLKFAVTAPNEDTWAINQASVSYKEVSNTPGSETVPNGGDEGSNQDTCNGTYKLHSVYGNFGDPLCNFTKDGLYALLKQSDPAEADYWFNTVVRKESSYNPNIYNSNSTSGLGAFGLFQMNPLGKGNTQYDAGTVAWQRQTTNAINYNNFLSTLGRTWCYWEAAHERWPAICRK